jgi:hypothetical protein
MFSSTKSSGPKKSHASTSALSKSLVIKNSPGVLYKLKGDNDSASEQFIQLHDSATVPDDGVVPKESIRIPADTSFTFTFDEGLDFSNGIVVTNSSTLATKTIGSSDDCWFTADYL